MCGSNWIVIGTIGLPTLMIIIMPDFTVAMLAESARSFVGTGSQPPEFASGRMISQDKH